MCRHTVNFRSHKAPSHATHQVFSSMPPINSVLFVGSTNNGYLEDEEASFTFTKEGKQETTSKHARTLSSKMKMRIALLIYVPNEVRESYLCLMK